MLPMEILNCKQVKFDCIVAYGFGQVGSKINSPFPRYFKGKGDRETLALERGYGKYTSNMADNERLQVHARKDELQRDTAAK